MKGKKSGLRLVLGVLLVLGGLAGSSTTGSAESHAEAGKIYFPWVPNGAMLGNSGPYYGAVTIQNLEDELIGVYATPTVLLDAAEPPILTPWEVEPLGSRTLTLEQLGVGSDIEGSGVVVEAMRASDGQPARISGVLKQTAPEPPFAGATTGPEHKTAGGYTALLGHEIGESIVLPIVQSNSGWNTLIRVTNFAMTGDPSQVSLSFFEAETGQNVGGFSESIGPDETATIDLTETQLGAGWVGSVQVTADVPIGAVAERFKDETSMLIINVSRTTDSDSTLNVAPLILREWNHWNTGISIANLVDQSNLVTVSYFSTDGTLVDSDQLELPPHGMDFIYTPALGLDDAGFVGSALIQAEHPFHGAVDQVKYHGEDEDTGHAMSYMVETDVATAGDHLTLPLVQKGDPENGLGDTSGIQIFNPASQPSSGSVWFFDEIGELATPEPIPFSLGSRQGATIYTMFYDDLPAGFQGSGLIRVSEGTLAAASNNVNYEVQFDGSASLNLIRASGLLGPYHLTVTADPNPVPHFSQVTTLTATVTDRFGDPVQEGESVLFAINDIDRAHLIRPGEGGAYVSLANDTDQNGNAYAEVQLRDDALGDRPVEASVLVQAGGLEAQVTITWEAPLELTPPDFSSD